MTWAQRPKGLMGQRKTAETEEKERAPQNDKEHIFQRLLCGKNRSLLKLLSWGLDQ